MNLQDAGHSSYEALAAGYALAALEPEDEGLFLAHFHGCLACKRAVAEHTDTLGHLAYAVVLEQPSPSVLEGNRAGVVASGSAGSYPAPPPLAARIPLHDRPARTMTAILGAAAALVLVVALLVSSQNVMSQDRNQRLVGEQLNGMVSSLLVPGAHQFKLSGDGGRGAVIVDGQNVSLVMAGVAKNDTTDSVYVLWQKGTLGDVRAVGAFDVPSTDVVVIKGLGLGQPVETVHSFIVTREHGRVAPARTSEPAVIAGNT